MLYAGITANSSASVFRRCGRQADGPEAEPDDGNGEAGQEGHRPGQHGRAAAGDAEKQIVHQHGQRRMRLAVDKQAGLIGVEFAEPLGPGGDLDRIVVGLAWEGVQGRDQSGVEAPCSRLPRTIRISPTAQSDQAPSLSTCRRA